MDVRSLKLLSRAFSFDYSVFFFKIIFSLFLKTYTSRTMKCAERNHREIAQISSDFQIGTIFLLCPNRFARYCESEPVSYIIAAAVCVCVCIKKIAIQILFKKTKDDLPRSNMVTNKKPQPKGII